jgi:peptide deformylase
MIENILTIPENNNELRQKSKEVITFDSSVSQIVTNLTETMEAQTDPIGLGLSAPQIGVFKRIFVARVRNRIKAFINPAIIKFSKKEADIMEGCFSVPDLYGHVIRPAEIDLKSQDAHGKTQQTHYKGMAGRIIQHELDHLDGILFIDHVHNQNGKVFKVKKSKTGKESFIEVPLP